MDSSLAAAGLASAPSAHDSGRSRDEAFLPPSDSALFSSGNNTGNELDPQRPAEAIDQAAESGKLLFIDSRIHLPNCPLMERQFSVRGCSLMSRYVLSRLYPWRRGIYEKNSISGGPLRHGGFRSRDRGCAGKNRTHIPGLNAVHPEFLLSFATLEDELRASATPSRTEVAARAESDRHRIVSRNAERLSPRNTNERTHFPGVARISNPV